MGNEAFVARPRIEALDSMRFLAAFVVLVAHFQAVDPAAPRVPGWLAGMLDARAAVALFFVLSGLVLHLRSTRSLLEWPSLWRFYLRRWLRIYPLYYLALLLAVLVISWLPLHECPWLLASKPAARVLASNHLDFEQWLHHGLLFSPGINTEFLVPPIWTLAEEARVALIFPWLSWLMMRCSRAAGFGLVLGLFTLGPWLSAHVYPTVGLLGLFVMGAWLAEHHQSWLRMHECLAWLAALGGLLLYSSGASLHWRLSQPAMGVGAALMLLGVMRASGLRRLLELPCLRLGGRCSYGLYVMHYPLLLAAAWIVWAAAWPSWCLYVIGAPLCSFAVIAACYTIEWPAIALGKQITSPSSMGAATGHTTPQT